MSIRKDGLGVIRRAALLAHFGSIDKLRTASAEQIAEVEGFGPKLAAELHRFLASRRDTATPSATPEPPGAERPGPNG